MVSVNTSIAYLIGLIVGKGYIEGENKVSIEFPFANEVLEGIAHCPLCGYLATKPPSSSDGYLLCKNKTCKNSKIVIKRRRLLTIFFKTTSPNNIVN